MSNSTSQEKTRVKSLATSHVKKKFINNKWRRICSVENCEKQSQRKGLCARHLSESKNQQQPARDITLLQQTASFISAENSDALYHNATNSFLLNNNQYGNTSSTTIHTSQIESTIIPCSTPEQTQYASAHTTDNNRCSITIVPTRTYRCMHCCSWFCLKHGNEHQKHLKDELEILLDEAEELFNTIPELNIDSGRAICTTQLNQWAQMMHETINQKYNELQQKLDQKHNQIEKNKNFWATFMRNELDQNVSCVLIGQLQKDEIDGSKVDTARKEFDRLQQLFHSLHTKPLISLSNVDVRQVDLDTYSLVLPKITMTDYDWMTNLSTENTVEIMDFSDQEQTEMFTISLPSGYRNYQLEQSIINQKGDSVLDLSDQELNAKDMKIIIYYALQNNT
ncbi:unnamed protein product, partial [Adineta steineri]